MSLRRCVLSPAGARMVCLGAALLLGQDAAADAVESATLAAYLGQPVPSLGGVLEPIPAWGCGGSTPPLSILSVHLNWHCTFDATINPSLGSFPNDGNRFFGFHRQFLYAYNLFRQSQGRPFLQTWMPSPSASMPLGHATRPDLAACTNCTSLPANFRLPAAGGTLNPATTTLEDYGSSLVPWHNNTHVAMAQAGGTPGNTCFDSTSPLHFRDIMCVTTAPRDPMFFRFHNFVNDLQDELLTFQDTDVMIVFDKSGSMTLPNGTGSDNRLNSAKNAARLFADLLRDSSNNRVGLISFSTAAAPSPELPLTIASSAPAAMNTALTSVNAGGATSIGGGLRAAVTALNASSNPNKAILLLTDGVENTAPMIAEVQGRAPNQLRDTHLCAVGFGTPGSLDGPKLRDLAERQGGAYRADADPLTLNKYFVECFADIFDTFVGKDPIGVLRAGAHASAPTVHVASSDTEVVFVLSWEQNLPKGALRLAVTTPTGVPLNLNDANVESRFGATYHIVRVKLPYGTQRDGRWTARAVRPLRSFLNGFAPGAFKTPAIGTAIVGQQLAQLCEPGACNRVLYYEDFTFNLMHGANDVAYYQALLAAKLGRHLGTVERVSDPKRFAAALAEGRYDLIVSSTTTAEGRQPYDDVLSKLACAERGPKLIVTDLRKEGNESLLRCLGAQATSERDFDVMKGDGQVLTGSVGLSMPGHAGMGGAHTHGAFSAAYKSTGAAGSSVAALSPGGGAAILARTVTSPNVPITDQRFFIESLASGSARVRPHTYISPNYTGERLHPTFHIPEIYIPVGGFDKVTARVEVTRPLQSQSEVLARTGSQEVGKREGDTLNVRQTADLRANPKQSSGFLKTETLTFPLNDDGKDGDTSAGDRYWEVALPPEVSRFDGEYTLHAYFTICQGTLCFEREAQHTVVVDAKPDPRASKVERVQTPNTGPGLATVRYTPLNAEGLPLGPDRQSLLRFEGSKGVTVQRVTSLNAQGTYEITARYDPNNTNPSLVVTPFGRPEDKLTIPLR
ncbi:vWA domain-containing protein [Deinococcus multiflagellatus]|uniref:vWA domain-containing protein n=1 Tax=Deinococcus multiflagellatus TaxID=1656887 RepID=UPI001CC90509|nr:vWA domain-containing protein [Deinococcus multiflagellatus]MBZ9713514.1 VWA domain-containing protein [Deinococcus multiflagellatus]